MPAVAVLAGVGPERNAALFADDGGTALGVLLGAVCVFRLAVAPGAEGAFLGRRLAVSGGQVPLFAVLAEIRREVSLVFGAGVFRGLAGFALGVVLGERFAGLVSGAGLAFEAHGDVPVFHAPASISMYGRITRSTRRARAIWRIWSRVTLRLRSVSRRASMATSSPILLRIRKQSATVRARP